MERILPHPDVTGRRLGDEVVLVHLGTDRIHTLNGTGARIWELLAETGDPREVRRRLLEEYDVEEAALDEEIARFLDELERSGLVRREPA